MKPNKRLSKKLIAEHTAATQYKVSPSEIPVRLIFATNSGFLVKIFEYRNEMRQDMGVPVTYGWQAYSPLSPLALGAAEATSVTIYDGHVYDDCEVEEDSGDAYSLSIPEAFAHAVTTMRGVESDMPRKKLTQGLLECLDANGIDIFYADLPHAPLYL